MESGQPITSPADFFRIRRRSRAAPPATGEGPAAAPPATGEGPAAAPPATGEGPGQAPGDGRGQAPATGEGPELLRSLVIDQPNHVWCADISYIPMRRGFLYLLAVLDWATRRVLTWRLSHSLTTDFCVDAVEDAIATYGRPEIFNTDQGCQFTDKDFVGMLKEHGIGISMDGKGAWRDNVFIERFWRSLKYEEVYLRAYESATEAKAFIGRYVAFYNQERPHSSLGGQTPDAVYFNQPTEKAA